MDPTPNPTQRLLHLAAVQCFLGGESAANHARLLLLVETAARQGAQVICLPELFDGPYFCCTQDEQHFARAQPFVGNTSLAPWQALAARLQVVLILPFFERDGVHYYNSVAVVERDGSWVTHSQGGQVYRKSHIPQGPGYEEKFYFRPGNTGFVSWPTHVANLGIGICWDQWYPEAARAMLLAGAEVLLYPTAIGSEPSAPQLDTQAEWELAMRGHAVHNRVAVLAANRYGQEDSQTFYGSSFIANHRGEILHKLPRDTAGIASASLDLHAMGQDRATWGFFRDRRPALYSTLVTA